MMYTVSVSSKGTVTLWFSVGSNTKKLFCNTATMWLFIDAYLGSRMRRCKWIATWNSFRSHHEQIDVWIICSFYWKILMIQFFNLSVIFINNKSVLTGRLNMKSYLFQLRGYSIKMYYFFCLLFWLASIWGHQGNVRSGL